MNPLRTESIQHIFTIATNVRVAPRTICLAVRMYDRASIIRKLEVLEEHLVTAVQSLRLAAMMENDTEISLSHCTHPSLSNNAPLFKKSLASALGYRLPMKTPLDLIDEICYPALEINNYSEQEMATKKTLCYYLTLLDLGLPPRGNTFQIASVIDTLATYLLDLKNVSDNPCYRVLWTISQMIPEITTYAIQQLERLAVLPAAQLILLNPPEAAPEWELESGEIKVMKLAEMKKIGVFHTLGESKYTLVRAAIPYSTSEIANVKLAIKTIESPPSSSVRKKRLIDRQLQEKVFREISALSRLDSRHVVKLHGFYHDITRKRYQLVLTNGGKTLEQILEDTEIITSIRLSLIRQFLNALEYIHSRHVIHGNLSLDNILVDSEYCLRLIGFGSASILHSDHTFQRAGTTSSFGPLERGYVSHRDDLQAAGMIISQILLGLGKDLSDLNHQNPLEYSIIYSMIHEEMSASRVLALFSAL